MPRGDTASLPDLMGFGAPDRDRDGGLAAARIRSSAAGVPPRDAGAFFSLTSGLGRVADRP